jgi:predicted transposase YbfD/YdcC
MSDHPSVIIKESFKDLEDPRVEYLCDHKLFDIIVLAICAVICGADHWTEVETYGQMKEKWLRTFLELPHGIPSHDTIGDLFARLDPEQFRRGFLNWVQAVNEITGNQVIAVDGKTLRRSHDGPLGMKAIHMVSAWATANQIVLGQVKVDDKSNEITAIPALLDMLALSGSIVTIDAMGCQKEIARKIVAQGADYVLAVKRNQPTLQAKIEEMFTDAEASDYVHTSYDHHAKTEKNHGRIETRRCWVIDDPDYLFYIQGLKEEKVWPSLSSIIKIEATRRLADETSSETRYYISSCADRAQVMSAVIRAHWGVENGLHWVLDVAFREDDSRVRKGHGPELLAILRHMALNLLKQERTAKAGIKAKRLRAGWDDQYLLTVLRG